MGAEKSEKSGMAEKWGQKDAVHFSISILLPLPILLRSNFLPAVPLGRA